MSVENVAVVVQSDEAPAPIGPYSQAIAWGSLVFCSGQVALDARSGQLMGAGDVRAEAAVALANLEAVLAAAGCSASDVVKTTLYLIDMADFPAANEVYARVFGVHGPPPARATVAVAALPKGARFEIDAIAARRPG